MNLIVNLGYKMRATKSKYSLFMSGMVSIGDLNGLSIRTISKFRRKYRFMQDAQNIKYYFDKAMNEADSERFRNEKFAEKEAKYCAF